MRVQCCTIYSFAGAEGFSETSPFAEDYEFGAVNLIFGTNGSG